MIKHSAKYLTAICSISGVLYATTAYSGINDLSRIIKNGWYWHFQVYKNFHMALPHLVHVNKDSATRSAQFTFYTIPPEMSGRKFNTENLSFAPWRNTTETKLTIHQDDGFICNSRSLVRNTPTRSRFPGIDILKLPELKTGPEKEPCLDISWRPISFQQCYAMMSLASEGDHNAYDISRRATMEQPSLQSDILGYLSTVSAHKIHTPGSPLGPVDERDIQDLSTINLENLGEPGDLFSSKYHDSHILVGYLQNFHFFIPVPSAIRETSKTDRIPSVATDPSHWDKGGLKGQTNSFPSPIITPAPSPQPEDPNSDSVMVEEDQPITPTPSVLAFKRVRKSL